MFDSIFCTVGSGGTYANAVGSNKKFPTNSTNNATNGIKVHQIKYLHTHGQSVDTVVYYQMYMSQAGTANDYEVNQQNLDGSGQANVAVTILQEIA